MAASRSEVGGIGHLSELSSSAITGFIMMTMSESSPATSGSAVPLRRASRVRRARARSSAAGSSSQRGGQSDADCRLGTGFCYRFSRSARLTGLDDDPVVVEHCDLLPSDSGFPGNGKSMVMSSRCWSMTSTGQCACTRIIPTSRAKDPLSGSGAATSPAASLGISVIGIRRLLLR
jgi:hypothetical protein